MTGSLTEIRHNTGKQLYSFYVGWSRIRFFDFGKHHLDGESWKLGDQNLAEIPNLAPEWKVSHQFQTRNYQIGDSTLPFGLCVRLDATDYSTSYDPTIPKEGLQLWNEGDKLGEFNPQQVYGRGSI